jgi:hypothetical protein
MTLTWGHICILAALILAIIDAVFWQPDRPAAWSPVVLILAFLVAPIPVRRNRTT